MNWSNASTHMDPRNFWLERASQILQSPAVRDPLTQAWSAFLDVLLDLRLEDGTPLLPLLLELDPDLRRRFIDAITPKPKDPS